VSKPKTAKATLSAAKAYRLAILLKPLNYRGTPGPHQRELYGWVRPQRRLGELLYNAADPKRPSPTVAEVDAVLDALGGFLVWLPLKTAPTFEQLEQLTACQLRLHEARKLLK
jgi:hypothetical protein